LKKTAKEKNYFCEICIKNVRSKMDQQQNGQRQKGPQQNWLRQSGRAIKSCTQLRKGTKMFLEPKFFSIYSQISEIRV